MTDTPKITGSDLCQPEGDRTALHLAEGGTARHWFTARAGSTLAWWKPGGVLEGVIEVHPAHQPIIHWLDGRHEEVSPIDYSYVASTIWPQPIVTVGSTVDMAEPNDPDAWVLQGETWTPEEQQRMRARKAHELNAKADGGKLTENKP